MGKTTSKHTRMERISICTFGKSRRTLTGMPLISLSELHQNGESNSSVVLGMDKEDDRFSDAE